MPDPLDEVRERAEVEELVRQMTKPEPEISERKAKLILGGVLLADLVLIALDGGKNIGVTFVLTLGLVPFAYMWGHDRGRIDERERRKSLDELLAELRKTAPGIRTLDEILRQMRLLSVSYPELGFGQERPADPPA